MSTSTPNNDDVSSENNSANNNDSPLRRRQLGSAGALSATLVPNLASSTASHSAHRPSEPQPVDVEIDVDVDVGVDVDVDIDVEDIDIGGTSSSNSTVVKKIRSSHHPHITPCSLIPATWSKRRIYMASCGCLFSVIVCAVRLLLDPGPSAYIIHSIIILFDMVLIHVFTHSLWLSVSGEATAIIFAICFHLTHETIFELLETTLIAVLCSVHMINSRNEHWDREEDLERDIIELQFYTEHPPNNNDRNANADEVVGTKVVRRHSSSCSSAQISDHEEQENKETNPCLGTDVEAGAFVPQSDMTNISAFSANSRTEIKAVTASNEGRRTRWWHHFFDHFLDGSAGVMYTSFLGLIIDEIVNYEWASTK
mmetsp:Transcript_21228/g.24431  ORF Transcript_21228/g.24431 Transcript_21228/m.24431 type:complete len:368 (+) Transcript_21228:123-1226(+)